MVNDQMTKASKNTSAPAPAIPPNPEPRLERATHLVRVAAAATAIQVGVDVGG